MASFVEEATLTINDMQAKASWKSLNSEINKLIKNARKHSVWAAVPTTRAYCANNVLGSYWTVLWALLSPIESPRASTRPRHLAPEAR